MPTNSFEVGQVLICVKTDHRRGVEPYPITVKKIGRKWVNYESKYGTGRFDKESMAVDGMGYSSPGQIYLSMEAYQSELHRTAAIKELRALLDWRSGIDLPETVTVQRVRLVLEILKIGSGPDPLEVIQKLLAALPQDEQTLATYHAREELAAARQLFT